MYGVDGVVHQVGISGYCMRKIHGQTPLKFWTETSSCYFLFEEPDLLSDVIAVTFA